jgi:hypothetical protein
MESELVPLDENIELAINETIQDNEQPKKDHSHNEVESMYYIQMLQICA